MVDALLPFLGACVLVAAAPGPSTVLIIRNSLHSRRTGFATVLGNETGVFLWGVVAALGLTALLAASQVAYDVMRFAGAAVLVVFGVQAIRAARRGAGRLTFEDTPGGARPPAPWRAYRAGVLMNMANPKAAIFAMSFLPVFVPDGVPKLPAIIALAAFQALFEVAYYGAYVWGVGRLKRVLARARVRQRLEQISGGVLLALGLHLALDG